MDPSALAFIDKLSPIIDRLGTLGVMAVVIVTGSMGKWVFASQMRERLAEKEREITEQKAKNAAQERLIDRLSGVADRSTSMATTAVVHRVQEHRHREDAA